MASEGTSNIEKRRRVMVIEGFCIDADPMNLDWTKQTWDLPATNRAELLEMLAKEGTAVEEFKKLPVYLLNVNKIEWLKDL